MSDPAQTQPASSRGWLVFSAVLVAVFLIGLLLSTIVERRVEAKTTLRALQPVAANEADNEAMAKVLQMPDVKAKFELSGAATAPTTPEQFAARIAEEDAAWGRVVREANIKAD